MADARECEIAQAVDHMTMTKRELLAKLAALPDDALVYVVVRSGSLASITAAAICDVVDEANPLPFGFLNTDIDAVGM